MVVLAASFSVLEKDLLVTRSFAVVLPDPEEVFFGFVTGIATSVSVFEKDLFLVTRSFVAEEVSSGLVATSALPMFERDLLLVTPSFDVE